MNLANLLKKSAKKHSEIAAIKTGAQTYINYEQLYKRVSIIAGQLKDVFGLKKGDRIALAMKNTPEFIELLYAAWHGGFAVVPMNAKLHVKEFNYIMDDAGARLCFATPNLYQQLSDSVLQVGSLEKIVEVGSTAYHALLQGPAIDIVNVEPDDLAWLFYTSGTTGQPKGAALSHRNLMAMTQSYFTSVDQITTGDGIFHAAPMSHGSGLYIMCHTAKGGVQIIPPSGSFDEDEIFDLLPKLQGVTMFAAPTMVKRLSTHPRAATADTNNLKTIVYGGGPMYLDDLLKAQNIFDYKFVQIYGQGESPMTITSLDKAQHQKLTEAQQMDKLNSAGLAQASVEVAILDDNTQEVPRGTVGEISVRGDTVMLGYWQNPEATSTTITKDGWLLTGDIGQMDEQGFVTLTDRSKDVIISGGTNIYPREVEEIILQHPDVHEISVVGKPSAEWGEDIIAFVVGENLSADILDTYCLDNMARFKRPKEYIFLTELPKNNYGKILKTVLRQQLSENPA